MIKGKIRSVFVTFLTATLGNLLVVMNPKKVKELSDKGLTLVLGDNLTLSERLMRRVILKKLEKNGDHDKLAQLHKAYWIKQGDDFVNKTQDNIDNIHLPAYKNALDILESEISNESINFEKLIEIGTGNGKVLNYLSLSYPDIGEMIGIDLSKEQTKINRINYENNSRLEFVDGDVLDWIANHQRGNMVFLTFRGVLEYFTQKQLISFFEKLNGLGNVIFFAIEPIDALNDFETFPDSKVYGIEGGFSHNYVKLFEDAGFKVWYNERKKEPNQINLMSIVGVKNY
ncbi:MAG: methyltransferase domain-containing protein [Flavobacteriaceae bacterium]|nr:methyltransferase domain-containing protein [Flavobacteriaceae bacterium]